MDSSTVYSYNLLVRTFSFQTCVYETEAEEKVLKNVLVRPSQVTPKHYINCLFFILNESVLKCHI